MDRCVEKSFTAAIVVIGQKFIQDRPFFLQLGRYASSPSSRAWAMSFCRFR